MPERRLSRRLHAVIAAIAIAVACAALAANTASTRQQSERRAYQVIDAQMRLGWHLLRQGGEDIRVESGRLMAGTAVLNGNNAIPDQIAAIMGGKASIFMHDVRVATNITLPDGQRAIGTRLAQNSAYDAVFSGRSFRGEVDILGERYVAAYDPLIDQRGKVVGVLFAGQTVDRAVHWRGSNALRDAGLAAALVLGAGLILAHWLIGRPLDRMGAALRALAKGETGAPPVPADRGGALGDMGQSAEAIRAALAEVEGERREWRRTEAELQTARERLSIAIEAIDDAFALFDADERLVFCNTAYSVWAGQFEAPITPGMSFEVILRQAWRRGFFVTDMDEEPFVQHRLALFRQADSTFDARIFNGRWFRGADRQTPDGGRVALRTDITSLKDAEENLRVALDFARAANSSKTAFLSSMSHELRTPLNAILGFAQILESGLAETGTSRQLASVGQILKAGRLLLGIIDDILDYSRIEAGRIELSLRPVNLCALARDCIELITDAAAQRDIMITADPPPEGEIFAQVDPLRMRQVLLNLLTNAVKYNIHGGAVHVMGRHLPDGWARISVRDTGKGIPAEMRHRVFEAFDRLGAESSGVEGAGIGLTITRQLVELMGGKIGFDAEEGHGATFWIEIPTLNAVAGQHKDGASATSPRALRALYVEDDPLTLKVIASLALGGTDIQILCARTGAEALDLLGQGMVDFTFLDWDMTDMPATEVLEALRSLPQGDQAGVVAITSPGRPVADQEKARLGLQGSIEKPVSMSELRAFIRALASHGPRSRSS